MELKTLVCPECETIYTRQDFKHYEEPYCKICGMFYLEEETEEVDATDLME